MTSHLQLPSAVLTAEVPGQRVQALSPAEEAAVAAAEAVAAEAAAVIAAEAAAKAAATVNAATAAAAAAAIDARRAVQASGGAVPRAEDLLAAEATVLAIAEATATAASEVTALSRAAATDAARVARCAIEAAADLAASVVAQAASTAAETLGTASTTAGRVLAAASETAEEVLSAASETAEETLSAASETAEETLSAASATAVETLRTASRSAAEAVLAAAAKRPPGTAEPDADRGHRLPPDAGPPLAGHTEWAVLLADPVMAQFAGDPAETVVSFASPAEQGLWRDISLARRMEAALRLEEGRFEAAFTGAPAAMLVVSVTDAQPLHFLHVNEALARLTGYPATVLLGLTFAELCQPGQPTIDGLLTTAARTDEKSRPLAVLQRWCHADGHEIWVRIRMSPARAVGQAPGHWVCHIEDVTLLARADATQRHATRLRLASAPAPAFPSNRHAEPGWTEHAVLFSGNEDEMLRQIATYVGEGLTGGGHSLIITTPEHSAAVRAALPPRQLARAEREGRFQDVDAAQMLAGVSREGVVDRVLFEETVGGLILAHRNDAGIRMYGEMVGLLWRDDNQGPALRLEAMWNSVRHDTALSVLCGYSLAEAHIQTGAGLAPICGLHDHVYRG